MVDKKRKPEPPFPLPARTGFWSGETLRRRMPDILGPDYRKEQVEYASYRLAVGSEIFVSPADSQDSSLRIKAPLTESGTREIPPGQFALLITEETVRVPKDAIAFVSMRSKETKFRGLVNVSGFHVDPGYHGKILFAVFNAGPAPIHVSRGDPWFVIFFADLDRDDTEYFRDKPDDYQHIPSSHITPIANEFLTFAGLNTKLRETKEDLQDRITRVERDTAIMRWATALVITFFIAFSVRSCLPQTPEANLSKGSTVIEGL